MTSRVIVRSKGSVSSRRIVTVRSVPTGPRIFSTASFSDRPRIASPSRWVMKSPGFTPAWKAGVSSIGDTTLTKPFSMVTSMPRPPNSPRVCTRMSPKDSALR
jgi:hypothetical protein